MEIAGGGTLLEEQLDSEGIESDQADQLQMEILPSGPIEIEDMPLSELGSSQGEMLAPKRVSRDASSQSTLMPMPIPKAMAPSDSQSQSILKPSRAPKPLQTIAPMSYETNSEIEFAPVPVPRKPLPPK